MDDLTAFCRKLVSDGHGEPSFAEVRRGLKDLDEVYGILDRTRMHKHVLGFTQLRLASLDGREIRVHYWPSGGSFSEEPHTHLWDLRSYVLLGRIESKSYDVQLEEAGDSLLYNVRPTMDGTIREQTSRHVSASIMCVEHFASGDTYVVPQGTFHTSTPIEGAALTLVVTSQSLVDHPEVVTNGESPRAGLAPMTPVTDEDFLLFQVALSDALA